MALTSRISASIVRLSRCASVVAWLSVKLVDWQRLSHCVLAGLVPAIHDFASIRPASR